MNFDFERVLFYATLISGLIVLFDRLFLAKRRARQKQSQDEKLPVLIDYARSFFPILLIVFLLRAFLFEPFRIPSGSLEPTLWQGDFILVNKYTYGARMPLTHTKLIANKTPARGDVMVFRWPPNPSVNFIKRVIGLPGDHISYVNKELTINGQKIPQTFIKMGTAIDESGGKWQAEEKEENLMGVKHRIFIDPERSSRDFEDIVVPEGMYFVMGDNRDDSADSRYWGFVPDKNIVGKAVLVWMSWDGADWRVRFNRLGMTIN